MTEPRPSTVGSDPDGVLPEVRAYVQRHALPLRVWTSATMRAAFEREVAPLLDPEATSVTIPSAAESEPPEGPAVLLLALDELKGPQRATLLRWAQGALPGRPIVQGMPRGRDSLLDAINTWHAFRIVPPGLSAPLWVDAVHKAQQALALDLALSRCGGELRDDVARLSAALAELQATRERLLHGERLAALGQMTGMLMQRVQQHCSAMDRFTAALAALPQKPQLREVLDHATESTRAMQVLLQDMLALAENRSAELLVREELLDDLVQRSVAVFRRDPLARAREVELDCGCAATVRVDRYRIYHVLLNLLRNAAQASPPRQPLLVRTGATHDTAWIEVEDRGCGIAPDALERLFSPFFTTKGTEGTGLGLRMSRNAIERHGGTLTCRSALRHGSCFRVALPRHDARPAPTAPVEEIDR